MKVGLGAGVRKRPVRFASACFFDDGAKPNAPCRQIQGSKIQHGRQLKTIRCTMERDQRRSDFSVGHAFAIAGEAVSRPLGGRREVEFVIGGGYRAGNKGFKAGVLPEIIRASRICARRQAQTGDRSANGVMQPKAHALAHDTDIDCRYGIALATGVGLKTLRAWQSGISRQSFTISSQAPAKAKGRSVTIQYGCSLQPYNADLTFWLGCRATPAVNNKRLR